MENKARKYRLEERTTAERLACRWEHVLEYGDRVILAGYHYNGKGADEWFSAIYTYTTKDHTIEGEIRLEEVSERCFSDNGHAIAWAFSRI